MTTESENKNPLKELKKRFKRASRPGDIESWINRHQEMKIICLDLFKLLDKISIKNP